MHCFPMEQEFITVCLYLDYVCGFFDQSFDDGKFSCLFCVCYEYLENFQVGNPMKHRLISCLFVEERSNKLMERRASRN